MEIRSQPHPDNLCIFFRQCFCCRRKRQWNPINQRKPKVRREKSRVTFATKVNKVEPLNYDSTVDESSSDGSVHKFSYEERLIATGSKCSDENVSTTALLDERLSDSSTDGDSENDEGEILTLEAFVERYVKDTITAALNQWKKDTDQSNHTELQDLEEYPDS